ncbi:hypothetical protein AX16_002057 [Volvariella volvacea WC 439]|nr:hypothetical protein AX16_002057 [Volvariella volvacea WC 439]
MSTSVTDSTQDAKTTSTQTHEPVTSPNSKGKARQDENMNEEGLEDDEEDEDEDDVVEEDDSEIEESFEEIDPSAILPTGRRTRGVKVDYTTPEALEKAGLAPGQDEDDDDDEDVKMKE